MVPINLEPFGDEPEDGDLQPPAALPGGHADDVTPVDLVAANIPKATLEPAPSARNAFEVIARSGLNVRSGAGTQFPIIGSLALGTRVQVLMREGAWALVDKAGDGAADGHVLAAFLKATQASSPGATTTEESRPSAASLHEPLDVAILHTIMNRCAGGRVASKLDLDEVVYALNKAMTLANATTRLREIAFLSQAVIETDYFRTYTEYGKGKGKQYHPFYGRGIHQLTWQSTYAACSHSVFYDNRLVEDPDLIINDIETNIKATAWYWREYKPFNRLADVGDIDGVIHLLYGGTINSPYPKVRQSVALRRGFYTTIGKIII